MKHPAARLLIMSKAPDPGTVKTRLIPSLGENGAARLYATLLHQCVDRLVAAGLCPIELWCAPSCDHPFFLECRRRYGVGLQQQVSGDLGRRMQQALEATLLHSAYAVLVGADCPGLAAADIEEALQALYQGADVILGPALDGGYYLIAMRRSHAFLFEDMPWGTPDVLWISESRLRARGCSWHRLAMRRDLDTPEDYVAWQGMD